MKKIIGLCALLLTSSLLVAQTDDRDDEKKRADIHRQKIAYITTELALTEDESKSFWPVYEAYRSELEKFHELRQEYNKESREKETQLSEAELDRKMNAKFDLIREKVAVEQKYYERFKGVLPVHKVAGLYEAEEGFRKELMMKMRESRGAEGGRDREVRERPQERR